MAKIHRHRYMQLLCIVVFTGIMQRPALAEDATVTSANAAIQNTLNKFCADCHNEKKHKGDIRLDHFTTLTFDQQFELLGHVEEQVFRREMPPADQDKVPLPTEAERKSFVQILRQWDNAHKVKSAFSQKLLKYDYANYVDHERLFSGEFKNEKAFTYDRKWLVSEHIFNDRVNAILQNYEKVRIDNKDQFVKGRAAGAGVNYREPGPVPGPNSLLALANPFLLPREKTGVLYYANQELGSDTLLTMLGNTEVIAKVMINDLSKKKRDYLPVAAQMTALNDKHNAILADREKFLLDYIDDICADIYKGSNDSLLPVYTKLKVPEKINETSTGDTIDGWKLKFGQDSESIVRAFNKFKVTSKTKREIIEKSQRFWFHNGDSVESIDRRSQSLANKLFRMMEYKHYKGHDLVYKRLHDDEMATITYMIKKHRTKGMPYAELIEKCMAEWTAEFRKIEQENKKKNGEQAVELLHGLYSHIFQREPNADEIKKYTNLFTAYLEDMSARKALVKLAQTLLLKTEFIYRFEYGSGEADQYGRKMLSPRDASYALAYALTETGPDKELATAAAEGRLNTREDYKREVLRMLADRSQYTIIDPVVHHQTQDLTNLPIRKIRFLRDFFGYPRMLTIFKDNKRYGGQHMSFQYFVVAELDRLVTDIVEKDQNVFEELLTTDKFYVSFGPFGTMGYFDSEYDMYGTREARKHQPPKFIKVDNRKGILTHPAWLMAHAHNTETDIVVRGKWVREKLLAGSIPDVPITVDAVIPEDKTKTLRQRTERKTSDSYCWKCHSLMNPLGNAFEMYDDFGRYRTAEELEFEEFALNKKEELKLKSSQRTSFRLRYKTLPVDASGALDGTGDKSLDGKVTNALDLIDRLGKSTRVRQSIIRNAFRFFMGRNETLSDSKTLIDADEAYVKSGGSFDAVIVSLLTSDSFIYRKPVTE